MKKLYLHLGAHRTGTTFIQDFFSRNLTRINQEGLKYKRLHDYPKLRTKLVSARNDKSKLRKIYFEIFREIELLLLANDNVFFSYEGFLGDINLSRSKALYPDSELFCKCFNEFIQGLSVNINVCGGFCIRPYDSLIISTYLYTVRQGSTLTLSEYIEKVEIERCSWPVILKPLIGTFGGNMDLWDFNTFKRDPWLILSHVFKYFNIDPKVIRNELHLKREPSNPTAGVNSLEFQLAFNSSLSQIPVNKETQRKVVTSVNKHITQLLLENDESIVIADTQLTTLLKSRYNEELLAISEYSSWIGNK